MVRIILAIYIFGAAYAWDIGVGVGEAKRDAHQRAMFTKLLLEQGQ